MTARALVTDGFPSQSVHIMLGRVFPDGSSEVVRPADLTFERTPPHAAGVTQDASLTLPEDMARELLDALLRHFGGSAETQTLRKDYDAERRRVDKLIDVLIDRSATAVR